MALVLGYLGLVPFVSLSLALWFTSAEITNSVNEALLLYSAIILSFMGAVHWGFASADAKKFNHKQLALSVIPALIAWFAAFFDASINYTILYIAFAALCLLDNISARDGLVPDWYPSLRVPLTAVVVLALINAQLALVLMS